MSDFFLRYARALTSYVQTRDEASLSVGHELGRRALSERLSVLEIIENHSRVIDELPHDELDAALQFLLQTLVTLDVAIRGFLDLADRDEFRDALVNSLQEGFFVADRTGAVVEINDAFAELTGYGTEGLPYRMPHPWVDDDSAARERFSALVRDGHVSTEIQIRHRDGRTRWMAIAINAVTGARAYVGTLRDITATRATGERERAVARLATAVSVARSVDEVLSITLAQCSSRLDAGRLMAVVWPQDGADPVIHVAGEPSVRSWRDLDDDWRRTFSDARDWLPLTVTPVGAAPSAGTTRGFVAVLSRARNIVVCLEHRAPRRITAEDRQLVTALVGHLSLAMQQVRQLESARETSLTLQRAMLPPSTTPAGFAVRYEPAVAPLEIGGDFYDVLPVGDGRVGVIVGDCVGRGLAAAAVMGQLRASTRALLLTGAEPATLLEHLDSVAQYIPDAFCATVFAAIIDTASATMCYSSAGHVPPVLAVGGSPPELLSDGLAVPLAVHRDEPRPQAVRSLPAGSTLMIYTDGLVERRDVSIDDQIDRVAEVVRATAGMPVEAVADAVLSTLAPAAGYDDDVAIVVYRRAQSPLRIDEVATAERLSEVRRALTAWLGANGVPDSLAGDIVLVVNEACTNCAEHAYRGRDPGLMRVAADVDEGAGELHIRVSDSGSWKTPPVDPGTRGRGLLLIRRVSDEVDLDGTDAGTTVEMTFRLTTGSA